jgi:hypothetical protein
VGDKVLVKNMKRKKTLGKQKWLEPYVVSNIPRIGPMTLSDNEKVIGNYRQNNLKRYYENCEETPEENTGETIDDDNHDTSNMIAEDNSTSDDNNNERSSENLNISTSAKDDDDIFLTQSTFDAQAEVDFDIDVDQMIMFESPKKTDDPAEPTRPKRNCQKDRRNSLYGYFPIVKKH